MQVFLLHVLRSESPSGMCAKLHTVAASNNGDPAPWLLYYCLFAPRASGFSSSPTSRSSWITHSTPRYPIGSNTRFQINRCFTCYSIVWNYQRTKMRYQILARSQWAGVHHNFDPARSWHRTAGRWIPGAHSSVSCNVARKKKRNWRSFFPGKQRRKRRSISRSGTPKRKSKDIADCWILSSFASDIIVPQQNFVFSNSQQTFLYLRCSTWWCTVFVNFAIGVLFLRATKHSKLCVSQKSGEV